MDVFRPPSVFSYFAPATVVPGTAGVRGPEFGLFSTSTALRRDNFVNTMVFSRIAVSANAPAGTSLDLTPLQALAANPAGLVDSLNDAAAARHDVRRDAQAASSARWPPSRPPTRSSASARPSIWSSRRRSIRWRDSHAGHPSGVPAADRLVRRLRARRRRLRRRRPALQPDQRLRAGLGLPRAGVRLPGRRQRRQQHGRPHDTTGYNAYATVRGASGLAIARDALLPITPVGSSDPFGLHPSLLELQTLWNEQKLAVVCNVGPLVQPITRQHYQGGAPRPYQLFSHSDQIAQWQTAIADRVGQTGWGGRTADRFAVHPSGFPMITALSGGIFTRGQTTTPLSVAPRRRALNQVLVLNGFGTAPDEVARRNSMDVLRTLDSESCADRRRQPDDAAGAGHRADSEQRRDAGDGVPEHHAGQSADAGREGDQVQRDVARARAHVGRSSSVSSAGSTRIRIR